jgi:hypothetical protein
VSWLNAELLQANQSKCNLNLVRGMWLRTEKSKFCALAESVVAKPGLSLELCRRETLALAK